MLSGIIFTFLVIIIFFIVIDLVTIPLDGGNGGIISEKIREFKKGRD